MCSSLYEIEGNIYQTSWSNREKDLRLPTTTAGANQRVHWFIGGKGLGIQQGMSVWVGSPKSYYYTLEE